MEELSLVQRIAIWALPLIFAVTVHEAAHGWVADRLGDPTARKLGRIGIGLFNANFWIGALEFGNHA